MIGENIYISKIKTCDKKTVCPTARHSQFNAPFQLQMQKLSMARDFLNHSLLKTST